VQLKSWALPLIVLALIVPPIAAFAAVGPQLGLAVGALAAGTVVVIAARSGFGHPIDVGSAPAGHFMILVVVIQAVEDPATAAAIAQVVSAGASATVPTADREPEVLLLAPALNSPVAHWLSDLRRARFEAQRRLALSVGSLAAAGIGARGQVGDSDPVQAVEDTLRSFPAREVVFVAGGDLAPQVEEVRRRLDRPVRLLEPARAEAQAQRHS
jgi:hypothetical protein